MIERSHRVFALQDAPMRDIDSIQNWFAGNGCIAREESAFLEREDDLLNLASSRDYAIARLEPLIELITMFLCKLLKKVKPTHNLPSLRPNGHALLKSHAVSRFPLTKESQQYPQRKVSRDDHVFVLTGSAITIATRSVIAWFIIVLLFVPIIALSAVTHLAARMGVALASTAIFVVAASALTRANTVEVLTSGATSVTPGLLYLSAAYEVV